MIWGVRSALVALAVAIGLSWPGQPVGPASAQSGAARDAARYTVFVHRGGATEASTAGKVVEKLKAAGFVIGGVDDLIDSAGGPGVDYFGETDLPGASAAASIANEVLSENGRSLAARRQKVANPAGYLGLWLFARSGAGWLASPPATGWCVQQRSEERFLMRCYETEAICTEARGVAALTVKTPCTLVSGLLDRWTPRPGGWKNSWYEFRPKGFDSPFPRLSD